MELRKLWSSTIPFFLLSNVSAFANPIYAQNATTISTQTGNAFAYVIPSGTNTYDFCPNSGWKAIRITNNSGSAIALPFKTQAEWEDILNVSKTGITATQTCCSQAITYTANNTVTIPAGCTRLMVYAWAAGGDYNSSANGLPGGFIYARQEGLTPGSTIQVVLATPANGTVAGGGGDAGGTGGTAGAASGGTGGTGGTGAETAPLSTAASVAGTAPNGGTGKYGGGGGGGGAGGKNGTGLGPGNGAAGSAAGAGGGATKVILGSGTGTLLAVAGGGGGGGGAGGAGGSAGFLGAAGAAGAVGGNGGSGLSEAPGAAAYFLTTGTTDTVATGFTVKASTAASGVNPVTGVNTVITTQNAAATLSNGSSAKGGSGAAGTATGGTVTLVFDAP